MENTELSIKKDILRTLMKCPHGNLDETIPTFNKSMLQDPLFTGKVCYALTLDEFNNIRDLSEAGIAFLLTSKYPQHREAGRVMFQTLEPYRAYRVSTFVHKSLKSNRQVQGSVTDYLKILESNKNRFNGAVKVAASKLHKMYEFYHVKPGSLAQEVLFDHKTPEGEEDIIEILKKTEDPNDQAAIIVTNRIPYKQATSVIKKITPAVLVAFIEVMTIPEIVNSRAMIESSGVLNDSRIREIYEKKLALAGTNKRVVTSTLGERKSTKGSDERLNKIIKEAEQKKIDNSIKITADTDIYVDCSGSMQPAIELAKIICPQVAALCSGNLRVFGFNEVAWDIYKGKGTIEQFRTAFMLVRASSNTSLGSALLKSYDKTPPEQVIYITDQGENRSPYVVDVYKNYKHNTKFIFLNVSGNQGIRHHLAEQLDTLGADVLEFEFKTTINTPGFYSDLDNFTTLLTKGGYTELVTKIMNLELPTRKIK